MGIGVVGVDGAEVFDRKLDHCHRPSTPVPSAFVLVLVAQ